MVLKPEPVFNAMKDLQRTDQTRVILMCPQGRPFSQEIAQELSEAEHIVFICGHYEGYDERIRTHLVTDEISIGDYVLTGGELPDDDDRCDCAINTRCIRKSTITSR